MIVGYTNPSLVERHTVVCVFPSLSIRFYIVYNVDRIKLSKCYAPTVAKQDQINDRLIGTMLAQQ